MTRERIARELCKIHWKNNSTYETLCQNVEERAWLCSTEYKDFWLELADHVEKMLFEQEINFLRYFHTVLEEIFVDCDPHGLIKGEQHLLEIRIAALQRQIEKGENDGKA